MAAHRPARTARFAAGLSVMGIGAALVVVVVLVVAVIFVHTTTDSGATNLGKIVRVGGLDYQAQDVRLLDPEHAGDARMLRGAGSHGTGNVWFGVFLTAQNPGRGSLPMARRFTLRDMLQHDHRPVALPPSNPFAYQPRTVARGAQSPGPDTLAQRDLGAEGGLLLFRVPRAAYESGPLELSIGDPSHPGSSGELILGS